MISNIVNSEQWDTAIAKINEVIDLVNDGPVDSDWVVITLSSPYSGSAEYRKIGSIVYLRGLIISSTDEFIADPIFTLPVGYRPAAFFRTHAHIYNPTISTAQFDITTDGVTTGAVAIPAGRLSIDGIVFFID